MTQIRKRFSIKRQIAFYCLGFVLIIVLIEIVFRIFYYQEHGPTNLAITQFIKAAQSRYGTYHGTKINKKAWAACFEENDLSIPDTGPREGFWDIKLRPHEKHQVLKWIEGKRYKEGFFDFDERGMQHVKKEKAQTKILILGGSVARGAYASSISETYFEQLSNLMEMGGYDVDISILAASAWSSWQELNAFIQIGIREKPDIVVFLNGLNDLTSFREKSGNDRAKQYLINMETAALFALKKGARPLVCLQPFLPDKLEKSIIEKEILSFEDEEEILKKSFQVMRKGLEKLEREKVILYCDCSQALNGTAKTMFADIWHFADLGHQKLADCLAESIIPLLKRDEK